MKIIINQRFGLGDLVFIMSIIRKFIAEGHEITTPVFPQFVSQFQRAYPECTWVDYNTVPIDYNNRSEHDWKGYRVLPIAWANEIFGREYKFCMKSKFDLFELDYRTWKDNAMWQRHESRELLLWGNVVPVKPYNLVNEHFQSDSKGLRRIDPLTNDNIVSMGILGNYSIFDWAKVLEGAKEIHSVSTSLLFILELLDLKCPIHLYSRPTDPNFDQVSYLFTKPYILHYD